MGLAINLILIGISFIAFVIAGGFITDSSKKIGDIPGYSTNSKLKNAHTLSAIAATVTWVTVALLLVGFVLMIFFGPEEAGAAEAVEAEEVASKSSFSFGNLITYGVLFLILIGVITVGILSAITADDIRTSGETIPNNAFRQAVIAASISIGVFVIMLIVLIVKFTHKKKEDEYHIFDVRDYLKNF